MMTIDQRLAEYARAAGSTARTTRGRMRAVLHARPRQAMRARQAMREQLGLWAPRVSRLQWTPRSKRWGQRERWERRIAADRRYRRREQDRLRRRMRRAANAPLDAEALNEIERDAEVLGVSTAPVEHLRQRRDALAAYAESVAQEVGGDYSGEVTHRGAVGRCCSAETHTWRGERYSRHCTYRRTDARHRVVVDQSLDLDHPAVRQSHRDGLPIITMEEIDHQTARVCWVAQFGKSIRTVDGLLGWRRVGREVVTEHRTGEPTRRRLALLHRDLRASVSAEVQRQRENQQSRREVARVLRPARRRPVTKADARECGYCAPGVEQFRRRHGLPATATVAQVWLTRESRAQRVARRVAARA